MASEESTTGQRQSSIGPVIELGERQLGDTGFVGSTHLQIVPSSQPEPKVGGCCGGGCGSGEKMPRPPITTDTVAGHCESCGKTSQFAPDRDGKIEECPHCQEFLDVGELGWEMTDFGEPLD